MHKELVNCLGGLSLPKKSVHVAVFMYFENIFVDKAAISVAYKKAHCDPVLL